MTNTTGYAFFGMATVRLLMILFPSSSAWVNLPQVHHPNHHDVTSSDRARLLLLYTSTTNWNNNPDSAWSVTDDWDKLSDANHSPNSDDVLSTMDAASLAALRMQNFGMSVFTRGTLSKEDEWLEKTIDDILTSTSADDVTVDVAGKDTLDTDRFLDSMGDEIAMLVRCNEDPRQLLIEQGRAVAELTDAERNDVRQLVFYDNNNNDHHQWKATPFLKEACATIFQQHSAKRPIVNGDHGLNKGGPVTLIDKAGIASWMNQCLLNEVVGQHEKRVTQTLARHGRGGTMTVVEFVQMYLSVLTGDEQEHASFTDIHEMEKHRAPEIEAVWRDIRNHGIVSPAEFERNMKVAALKEEFRPSAEIAINEHTILDECELLTEEEETSLTTDRHGKSSHEHVELVPSHVATKPIPVWIKDGDFGRHHALYFMVWLF